MIRWRMALGVAGTAGLLLLFLLVALIWWPRVSAVGVDRPPSVRIASHNDRIKLVVLGTSLSAYYDWPSALARRISDCMSSEVEVDVIARGGGSSRWGIEAVERVASLAPDLVLIEFAINDADIRHLLSQKESVELHGQILSSLTEAMPKSSVVLMTTSPVYGIKRLLRPRLSQYYASYPGLAETFDVGFLDIYAAWFSYPTGSGAFPDGVHPTPGAMHDVMVPTLERYLLANVISECS